MPRKSLLFAATSSWPCNKSMIHNNCFLWVIEKEAATNRPTYSKNILYQMSINNYSSISIYLESAVWILCIHSLHFRFVPFKLVGFCYMNSLYPFHLFQAHLITIVINDLSFKHIGVSYTLTGKGEVL